MLSIYYYFLLKDDFVLEVVVVYSDEVFVVMWVIDLVLLVDVKLSLYMKMFGCMFGDGYLICLCGMFVVDIEMLLDNVW